MARSIQFCGFGHINIRASHFNTIEFTSDKSISLRGDCIACVNCKFTKKELCCLKGKLHVSLNVGNENFSFECLKNEQFKDDKEIVFRRSEFSSPRTLGLRSTKASADIPESIRKQLQDPNTKILITIEEKE